MNVLDVMPSKLDVPVVMDWEACDGLMMARYSRFQALCQIEQWRGGLVRFTADLSSVGGQEVLRILLQRAIEEAGESLESQDPVHVKEEVIDALNFLWAAYLLDHHLFSTYELTLMLCEVLHAVEQDGLWKNQPLSFEDLGVIAYHLATRIGDSLRNRPWHQNSQDHYFAGKKDMKEIWRITMIRLLQVFSGWEEFWCYFVAKDRVLLFRINSNY